MQQLLCKILILQHTKVTSWWFRNANLQITNSEKHTAGKGKAICKLSRPTNIKYKHRIKWLTSANNV